MKRYVFNKYALPNYLFIMVLLAMAFSIHRREDEGRDAG